MHQNMYIYYFTKCFLAFKRFFAIQLSKYVFIFSLLDFFCVICLLSDFLLKDDLKN
jgi:hypothetical protein